MNTFLIQLKLLKQQLFAFLCNVLKSSFNIFAAVISLLVSLKAILPATNNLNTIITNELQEISLPMLMYFYAGLCVISIFRFWPKIKASYYDKSSDSEVIVECCDLFRQKGLVIIHSTDTFDTDLEITGTKTINGQFLMKNRERIDNITEQIQIELQRYSPLSNTPDESLPGNKLRYAYGTACPIIVDDQKFCLVAFGQLVYEPKRDIKFNPQDYRDFLIKMWTSLSESRFGEQQREIDVAIIGDGYINFPGAYTRSQKLSLMAETFFEVSRRHHICSRLKICVNPDKDALKIDYQNIRVILKYVSERPDK